LNKSENIDDLKINSNPLVRWILLTSGTILLSIGILGMFLPLLPTTIFFILAAWCYARSSERFYHWLHHNKFFGKYLSNYRRGNGMTIMSKTVSLLILWAGIGYSVIFATSILYIQILLLAIAIGVSWHLLSIKTMKE
jgi:uncharacterized membrane protein YbaN (DUF454 family)